MRTRDREDRGGAERERNGEGEVVRVRVIVRRDDGQAAEGRLEETLRRAFWWGSRRSDCISGILRGRCGFRRGDVAGGVMLWMVEDVVPKS